MIGHICSLEIYFRKEDIKKEAKNKYITLIITFFKSNGKISLFPLRARKSNNYRNSWKSNNFRKEAIKKEAKN